MESAPLLRRKADAAVRAGRFAEAASLYRREAAIYRRIGDLNGAKVEEMKADRFTSMIQLFAHPPKSIWRTLPSYGLSKHEPLSGCYLGAFIDRDERLGQKFLDENGQSHYDPERFAEITGKKHASVFCYVAYGRPFPSRWVERLRRQGVSPQIAWEPNQGLQAVQDDYYLREFAAAAAEADCPIFLRFASEMNGGWTRYGGDPLQYKIKWGIVHKVMAKYAPNVAMVWCVNSIPETTMSRFYPGDDFVDWVGVNCYSVPYHDNNPARSSLWENPSDLVKFVYDNYARRKPIMICEYGVSQRGAADGKDRSRWAARKIAEMYAALPRLYPRIKMVSIFDMNNLVYAQPGRQLNDYSITSDDWVRAAYTRAVQTPYFLSTLGETSPVPLTPLRSGAVIPPTLTSGGILRVSAWARCPYAAEVTVRYALNGREVFRSRSFGTYEATISVPAGPRGQNKLTASVTDDRGMVAAQNGYRI
ncbi:MAG: glycosyl hydrolase [Armatimonadota bacterium]